MSEPFMTFFGSYRVRKRITSNLRFNENAKRGKEKIGVADDDRYFFGNFKVFQEVNLLVIIVPKV